MIVTNRSVMVYINDVNYLRGSPDLINAAIDRSIEENTDASRKALISLFMQIEDAARRCAEHQIKLLPVT